MGADLCGHIMVGPIKLNRKKVGDLRKEFERIQAILKPAITLLQEQAENRTETDEVTIGHLQQLVGPEKSKELARIVGADSPTRAYITLWANDSDPVLDSFERLVDLDIRKVLAEFVNMWEGGRYRDKMSRFTPDGKERIVVVGERTWGDGPDEWSGWWLANQMSDFSLLAPLGIR